MTVKTVPMPSAEYLRECLIYDGETGRLRWRSRPEHHFGSRNACASWNGRFPGAEAGTVVSRGYRAVFVDNKAYREHRLIWRMVTGEHAEQIDHINGDTSDNRIKNLRPVNNAESAQNKSTYRNNRSGRVGVSWKNRERKWQVKIGQKIIGCYASFDAAVDAREKAEEQHGYHANHGRAKTRVGGGHTDRTGAVV